MDVDVYFNPTDQADYCWYCDHDERSDPEEGTRVFLCDAGHSPYNAECNYICERHLDPNVIKYVYQVMLGEWKREQRPYLA